MTSPKVINNSTITYSVGDTFILPITDDVPFTDSESLRFVVAANETSENLIDETFQPDNGQFNVVIATATLDDLSIGNYLYKIIISDGTGGIVTQKSGNFNVIWGA